jgi:antitoxin component YwqK of YwqJK toxin-antitoxin module
MKTHLTAVCLLLTLFVSAQKREEFFNFSFKPAETGHYYYVTTEKKDSGWYREAYYVSQGSMAMKGWYKDEACNIAHGPVNWYHHTRFLRSSGQYANGKKDGLWLGYDEKGHLVDSSNYSNGFLTGISFRFHSNGMASDSLHFDGKGNGVQVSWFDDGQLASAGRLTADTAKIGRWQYFHKNGTVMANEEYSGGKLVSCHCYTEAGQALDTADCREKEAEPANGIKGWQQFLSNGLQRILESKANSRQWPAGQRTVAIRFIVEKDGTLSGFLPLTENGKGMEEEVIKLLQRSPRWTLGRQWGRVVRSYHTQPLTFVIQ